MSEPTECKPVAWVGCKNDGRPVILSFERPNSEWNIKPLYASPLTQDEMRNVMEALEIGHDNGYWLAQCSEVSDQSDDILKDQKSISAAIAILKEHLHG